MKERALRLVSGEAHQGSGSRLADGAGIASAFGPERVLGPGDVVDCYRIEHVIASGGMARVYRAVHRSTGQVVALKVMRTRYSSRPDLIERFQNEAMALRQIRHSNVVAVENGGVTVRGEIFVAMELLRGRTLRELLEERGRLPLREALSILSQVAHGVSTAHDVNVVHRDLKPENIFCTSDGAVKVLDLGLSKFVGHDPDETDDAVVGPIGTAAYISPERLDGIPADPRSDIYSLGLIAYECLAGRHPMVPDGVWPSRQEIALRQLTYSPARLMELPPELWATVARAIHKNPERRFSSMDEVAAALHRVRHQLGELERRAVPRSRPIWSAAAAFEPIEFTESPASGSSRSASQPASRRPNAMAYSPRGRGSGACRIPDWLPWRHLLWGAVLGLFVSCTMFLHEWFAKSSRDEASIPSMASATPVSDSATPLLHEPSALPKPSQPRSAAGLAAPGLSLALPSAAPRPRPSGPPSDVPPAPADSPAVLSRDAASAVLEIWPPPAAAPLATSRAVDRPRPSPGPATQIVSKLPRTIAGRASAGTE